MQFDSTLNQAYYTPAPFSPLIDAIPANVNNCGAVFLSEQLNRTRPVDTQCDIGSIELQANFLPTAVADIYTTTQNITLTVPISGLLSNDRDGDWDTLTASINTMPSNGVASVSADGSFVYTPTAGYSGTDSFTYVAHDGQGNSAATMVTIHVVAAAVAPTVNITVTPPDLVFSWSTESANCSYGVYRSGQPYVGYSLIAGSLNMSPFTDSNAGNGMNNYFYYLEATNCAGTNTAVSNQMGAFNFPLTPGN